MKETQIKNEEKKIFDTQGVIIVPNVLTQKEISLLKKELELAIEEDLNAREKTFDQGMVHNCMFRGENMAKLLDNPIMNAYIKNLLAPSCIIYAYQSSSAPPQKGNYGSRIHVDCPRFIPNYITNIGVILPLDDFTNENGGTRYLPGSHLQEALPSEEYFDRNYSTVECNAGDMIVFNSRLAHATGTNQTITTRHALTINICRCYMRQRFDFCRMDDMNNKYIQSLNKDGKRLLGMNVRIPTTLDEFYLPEDERLYKPGQE